MLTSSFTEVLPSVTSHAHLVSIMVQVMMLLEALTGCSCRITVSLKVVAVDLCATQHLFTLLQRTKLNSNLDGRLYTHLQQLELVLPVVYMHVQ